MKSRRSLYLSIAFACYLIYTVVIPLIHNTGTVIKTTVMHTSGGTKTCSMGEQNQCHPSATHELSAPVGSKEVGYVDDITTSINTKKTAVADNSNNNNNNKQSSKEQEENQNNSIANNVDEQQQVLVTFVNKYVKAVSLMWEDETGVGTVILKSLSTQSRQALHTYVGHTFFFTIEGTRSRLGEFITIKKGIDVYELPSNAKLAEGPTETDAYGCIDRYPKRCKQDMEMGYCDTHPGWMTVNCPQSCQRCELLDPRKRCNRTFLNTTQDPWMKPGDLNKLFQDMEERTKQYKPVVVSRPPQGPWIVYFDNFLSDKEVEAFIKWGNKLGFERSTDTGPLNARGEAQKIVSQVRTSENTWCIDECVKDPIVLEVTKRIEEITKTPSSHYEDYQLLRYKEGQYYKLHHDMAETKQMEYGGGPRTLTFFLYLSDVEEGGETHFPFLKLKIAPKKGRAVLWPSVLDESSYKQDRRTYHEALPVNKGVKYAANHWIHSNDFKIANTWGCSGSFD